MTSDRNPRPKPAPAKVADATPDDGHYTGVATGSLGTAANLEDTQTYSSADLRAAAERAESQPRAKPEPKAEPAAAPAAPAAVEPLPRAPATARPRRNAAPPVPRHDRFAGLAGVLAVVFAVLAGAAFLVAQEGPGPAEAGAGPTPTAVPATEQPDKKDGNNGKGNGRGNGNGGGGED